MSRRGDSIGGLERDLAALRTKIADTEAEQARQAELASDANLAKRRAAGDEEAFNAADEAARAHGRNAERLGYLLDEHAKALVELETRLKRARYDSALAALDQAAKRRGSASVSFADPLAAALDALPALEAARDEYDAALARAAELCPDDVDLELPESADEAAYPDGVERLVEAIQSGPRRPLAKQAAGIEQARLMGEQRIRTHASQAAREALVHGDYGRLRRLTPEEQAAAVPAAEQLVGTFATEREREVAARRLERIRELVESEVSAAA